MEEELRIKRGYQWVGKGSGAEGGGSYSTVGGGAGGRQEGRPTEQRVHPGRGAERTRTPDPHRSGIGTRRLRLSDRRSEKQNKPDFEIKIRNAGRKIQTEIQGYPIVGGCERESAIERGGGLGGGG